jgi:hypothetical protein
MWRFDISVLTFDLLMSRRRFYIPVPPPPLKFRTAGFPQYGFKQEFWDDLRRIASAYTSQQPRSPSPCGPEGHVKRE